MENLIRGVSSSKNGLEICKVLIEAGININYIHNESGYTNGWTPLHTACIYNDLEIIELLLDKGSDESIKKVEKLQLNMLKMRKL